MNDADATLAIYQLSDFLFRHYKKKVIILLDEYDTPMQEAYVDVIREGSRNIKASFETLLQGETLTTTIDEQIVYSQLDQSETAIWSLLLASGYLKVVSFTNYVETDTFDDYTDPQYELTITNLEVKVMFRNMVKSWFGEVFSDYNDFIKALLMSNVKAMNTYMNRVSMATFSYFDTGKRASQDFAHAT